MTQLATTRVTPEDAAKATEAAKATAIDAARACLQRARYLANELAACGALTILDKSVRSEFQSFATMVDTQTERALGTLNNSGKPAAAKAAAAA